MKKIIALSIITSISMFASVNSTNANSNIADIVNYKKPQFKVKMCPPPQGNNCNYVKITEANGSITQTSITTGQLAQLTAQYGNQALSNNQTVLQYVSSNNLLTASNTSIQTASIANCATQVGGNCLSCNSSYNLNNNNCVKKSSYLATANYTCNPNCIRYSNSPNLCTCNEDYNARGVCAEIIGSTPDGNNICKYSYGCPGGGYTIGEGSICYKTSTYTATVNYTCPQGGTLSGTTCNY